MLTPETMAFNTDDVTVYLAAAGAGKTTAIMNKLTELLEVYRPDEIAFVTYTRKGVAHGIERALQANPQLKAEDLVHFKTLHALCFRELQLSHTSIITREDMKHFNRLLGFRVNLSSAYENQTEDDKILIRYDALRNGSKKGIYVSDNTFNEFDYTRLTKAYEVFKETNHLVDFHDCLTKFRDRGEPVHVKVALIDEAQDLTLLQWEVCKIAFSLCEKIVVSGDDFQCLFSYNGASPRTLVRLAQKYKTIKLETSYRLPKAVYRFAKGITGLIADKIDKDFEPSKDIEGFVKEVSSRLLLARYIQKDFRQNSNIPYRWYLLFRNNCFISKMADILEQLTVPYFTPKGFCLDVRNLNLIKRYYNFRKEGFGTKEALDEFCEKYKIENIQHDFIDSDLIPSERRYVYFDYVQKYGIDGLEEMSKREPFLLLSTTHKVKGGEADYVAVFMECTKKTYQNLQINLDEELRVLYVACSRARLGLYTVPREGKYGLDSVVDLVKELVA